MGKETNYDITKQMIDIINAMRYKSSLNENKLEVTNEELETIKKESVGVIKTIITQPITLTGFNLYESFAEITFKCDDKIDVTYNNDGAFITNSLLSLDETNINTLDSIARAYEAFSIFINDYFKEK
jgi:hypothetical protein